MNFRRCTTDYHLRERLQQFLGRQSSRNGLSPPSGYEGWSMMDLRLLNPDDAPVYRRLRLQALREWPPAFGTPPEEEENLPMVEFARRLEPTVQRRFLGAFESGVLVGSLRLSHYDGGNESHKAYLAGLFIEPAHRRKGHGRALLAGAVALAKSDPSLRRLNLTVVSGQEAARALYLSAGFTECGIELEAFECQGSYFDEILMTCALRVGQPASVS